MDTIAWQVAATLPAPAAIGVAGPLAGVHNDVLLVAGGANFPEQAPWRGGRKAYHRQGFAFTKTGQGSLVRTQSFELPHNLAYPAVCSTPLGVLAAGGENEDGIRHDAWLLRWDPAAGAVAPDKLPDLPLPLTNAAAACLGNVVYLAGGQTDGGVSDRLFSIDLSQPAKGWTELPPAPAAVSHAVLLAQSDGEFPRLYLVGGRKSNPDGISDLYQTVYAYLPRTGSWSEKSRLPHSLSAATGVAAGATYLLIFSGDRGEVFSRSESLLAAIARETDEAAREELLRERADLLAGHPGFSREVLLYNTVTDTWTTFDTLPFPGQVTTSAVLWGGDIYLPSGEVRAGVRTPDIIHGRIGQRSYFSWLDYTVLALYLLLMVGIGLWTSRHQESTNDYFKGGQRIPGWAAGLSIYGTQLSAITFMSIPAKTYATNWNYFFLQMTIIMIIPVVARYFIPFYRRLEITSAYEYLEKRFSYPVRAVASLLFVFLQVGRLSIVLLLPSLALTLVTGIDVVLCILLMGVITIFYTMKGGIEAVIWTDVAQVVILLGGALLCILLMLVQLDLPPADLWQMVRQNHKLDIFDTRFSLSEPTLWVVLIGGLAINVISYGTDQTVVQRYLTTKDERTARRSLKLGAWMALPSTLIFFSIGTLLFLFFRQFPERINVGLQSQDAIFPWYIVSNLPAGVVGLLIAAIFAAAMSTLSSSMNSITTALTTDFYRRFVTNRSERAYLRLARAVTLVIGVIGAGFALIMAQSGISSLWDQFNTILGLFTGGLGGLFVLGLFTKTANAPGVLAGILLSGVVQYVVKTQTDVNLLLYAFTGLVSCVLFGYLFSLLFPGGRKQLSGLTIKTIHS